MKAPLSQFISVCLKILRRTTRYRYVVSYADTAEMHYGGVYQASNFAYLGLAGGGTEWWSPATGATCSRRAFDQRSPENKVGWVRRKSSSKHLYVYPLRVRLADIEADAGRAHLPYPKPDGL